MKALLIIDIQNDFLPRGALAVPEGDQIIPLVNELIPEYDLVVATQDWHPANHGSFAENHTGHEIGEVIDLNGLPQILWPTHCVEGTNGAEFADTLDTSKIDRIFPKGTDPTIDSYSGLFDNGHRKATGLGDYLKEQGVTEVHLVGLATDYCLKFTALDTIQEGFKTVLIEDACRGVNLQIGDVDKAVAEIQTAGGEIRTTQDLLGETLTLYRPIGPAELVKLEANCFTKWPARLPEQPIFYPVLNQEYAEQIAKNWNLKDNGAGYVTKFNVNRDYLRKFPRKVVGGKTHEELWIPAEDLNQLNEHIAGKIEVVKTFE